MTNTKAPRQCDKCGKGMFDGYIKNYEYYCSDKCLFSDGYTKEQWKKDYTDDGENYWTTWYSEGE